MNNIIKADIKILHDIVKNVFPDDSIQKMERLGGLTNHTYHISLSSGEYVIRIPGEGTEDIINREDEIISNKLACAIGIDSPLIYMDKTGIKVMHYVDEAVTMNDKSLRLPENIQLVAENFYKLHTCKENTNVKFEVFEVAENYERVILERHIDLFDDYEKQKQKVYEIREIINFDKKDYVPCHNDPLCENWIRSHEKMYLIDWEYAGMNDPIWDLADVSIEANYGEKEDAMLLGYYYKESINENVMKRFLANKIYIDYLWSLWGKTMVKYNKDMITYANDRYERMKKNLALWESLND